MRAAQDEQIRLKDIEVNELKSVRMDLERDLRDTRSVAEKVGNAVIFNCQTRALTVAVQVGKAAMFYDQTRAPMWWLTRLTMLTSWVHTLWGRRLVRL